MNAENTIQPKMHTYRLPGDWIVRVGKTDDDNDALSLNLASPKDWWFHVRGMPGSHVVLHHESKKVYDPDKTTLKKTAAIAAYHSKARGGGTVNVAYTRAHNVIKPKRARTGTVHIKKERLIKTRPEIPPDAKKVT